MTSHRYFYNNTTPLHIAIESGNSLEQIKEMLKDETTNINARDRKCNTPLRLVCMKDNIDIKMVKELLMHGATLDAPMPRRYTYRGFGYTHSNGPLGLALKKDKACANLLIKLTVLKSFEEDYIQAVDMQRYEYFFCDRPTYVEMCQFVSDCAIELNEMRKTFINNRNDGGASIYTWLQRKRTSREQLLFSKDQNEAQVMDNMLAMLPIFKKFPIYYDVLIEEMVFEVIKRVSRKSLLSKLREVELGAVDETNKQNVLINSKKLVYLLVYWDCTELVTKYLSEEDILNFIIAFQL